jgi:hypothetical protein
MAIGVVKAYSDPSHDYGAVHSFALQHRRPGLETVKWIRENGDISGAQIAVTDSMAGEVGQADVRALLERYHVHYGVHPYYVLWEQRPEGAPPLDERIQAGFDIDLSGTVDKFELPDLHREEYGAVAGYFEAVAREVRTAVGQGCTVEVITYPISLTFDTHLQSEAMLRIRISHCRGLNQSEGPAEEQALIAIRTKLNELGVRER